MLECIEDIKVKDEAEEEEDLVEIVVKLSATTLDNWGTTNERARTLHTNHINTSEPYYRRIPSANS